MLVFVMRSPSLAIESASQDCGPTDDYFLYDDPGDDDSSDYKPAQFYCTTRPTDMKSKIGQNKIHLVSLLILVVNMRSYPTDAKLLSTESGQKGKTI